MKESIFNILVYLFQQHIDNEAGQQLNKESLSIELAQAGFHHTEIDKAFNWLERLVVPQYNEESKQLLVESISIRIFTPEEQKKLNSECQGFLLLLEQVGILDPMTRELVIDRVMELGSEEFSLDQLKWVILMVLSHQPKGESINPWIEDFIFDGIDYPLH
ncbi:DUF494 family protein [Candidatus Nitrosacidococcus tergens]|uniref:Protein Smg homolog n=1 Tax=Candidatus Nitrosacidococcus tergens TaxID=553981 RepID=A0A7G1QBK2_9GAMM|nr:DUF494 domain-containing protein [Candidatus Nitrosacidococcus tergens]CAB1277290.1 conserved hypothetical protein [Candidatus Nitrosacidococcus tergens]